MEQVHVPESVDAGAPFSIMVSGYLSDPCWEIVNQRHLFKGNVITFDIFAASTATGTVAVEKVSWGTLRVRYR
jgi:hypothetical protein